MEIPICKIKEGESAHYQNGVLSITRTTGEIDSRPLADWTEDDGVRMDRITPKAEKLFDAKVRESMTPDEFAAWKATEHWTPGGAEGLAE
jgi:hypothetical protein